MKKSIFPKFLDQRNWKTMKNFFDQRFSELHTSKFQDKFTELDGVVRFLIRQKEKNYRRRLKFFCKKFYFTYWNPFFETPKTVVERLIEVFNYLYFTSVS